MEVTVLREVPQDAGVASSWNNLAKSMEHPEVFYTQEWALAASRAFSGTLQPLVLLVYESSQLRGVAALATRPESSGSAFFLTSSTADYCDILCEPAMSKEVLPAIFDAIRKLGVHDLVLASVPSDSSTLRELTEIAKAFRYHVHSRAAFDCGLILLGNAEERQATLQLLRRKDREKRALKKMAQLGTVRLTHLTAAPTELDLIPIFLAQVSRFLATRRVSPLVFAERRAFLLELSRLLGRCGWLKISRLEINGHPVAWNYGFLFFGSWFWYLPTFEVQHEHLSPGSCLLRLIGEEGCTDESLNRLDLGLGDEAYKDRFANAVRPTRYIRLSTSLLHHNAIIGRQWLADSIQRYPKIEAQIRKTRDISRKVRERGLIPSAARVCRKAVRYLLSDEEILLFQAPEIEVSDDGEVSLSPIDWDQVASAAIENARDVQTLQYLMRCAERLKKRRTSGFILREHDEQPRHFLWVDNYDGFHLSEIDHNLEAFHPSAAMIFDCWTPLAHRGRGYYAKAIRLAAASLQQQGKQAWIFSAAGNTSSLQGIRKAGFEYRSSLLRKRRLGRLSVTHRSEDASPFKSRRML